MVFHGTVMVPVTMVQLDESNASLRQTASQQAIRCKGSITSLGSVEIEHLLGFLGYIHQFWHTALHSEREFVLANARCYFWIIQSFFCQSIEGLNCVDDFTLLACGNPLRIAYIQYRVACSPEFNALVLAGQKS